MGKRKVGRNDQCPCGSGKKYKHCHLDRTNGGEDQYESFIVTMPSGSQKVLAPKAPSGDEWLVRQCEQKHGHTPRWTKKIIEDAIREVFDRQLHEVRGELCLYVSAIVARSLKEYEICSSVVAGSATWANYPVGFVWKGPAEFHAWCETEFGEIVDLACDSLHKRRGLPYRLPNGPQACWDKPEILRDREYSAEEDGAKIVGVFADDEEHLKPALQMVQEYIHINERAFKKRYGF